MQLYWNKEMKSMEPKLDNITNTNLPTETLVKDRGSVCCRLGVT